MAETVLAKMAVEISANAANFTKQLQSTQNSLNSFTTGLGNAAKSIGIAFGIQQVASFAFEVAKLAGEAEGVRAAFDRLPNSIQLMSQLKDATAGTVSELELMKRTVQATNFGIELQALPKLLEFAAVRAQQTGQSVDYLVDSIVTGIGRKSPLILDNLGISAVALREKMGGVALATASIGEVSRAVGQIANDELEKMGGFSENASTKIQRLSASWEDLKVSIGNAANSSGFFSETLNILTKTLNAFSGDKFTTGFNQLLANMGRGSEILEAFASAGGKIDLSWQDLLAKGFVRTEEAAKKYEKILADIAKQQKNLSLAAVEIDPTTGLPTSGGTRYNPGLAKQQVDTLDSLQEKIKELNNLFSQTDVTDKKKLANIGQEIIGVNNQIKALEALRKAREAEKGTTSVSPNSVNAYQKALEELNKELEDVNVKDTERIRIISAQIAGYEQAIQRVNDLKNSFKDLSEVVISPVDTSSLFTGIDMEPIVARFEEGLNRMANTSKTKTDEIQESFINMGPLIGGAISGIAQALGEAAAGVGNFGDNILRVVANFGKQLGEILIAEGVALLAAKFALKNPYTAIAAGVALVAISSAMNASIGKAHSSAFGSSGGGASGRAGSTVTNVSSLQGSPEQRIVFDAKFEIEGSKLVAVVNNTNKKKERTG